MKSMKHLLLLLSISRQISDDIVFSSEYNLDMSYDVYLYKLKEPADAYDKRSFELNSRSTDYEKSTAELSDEEASTENNETEQSNVADGEEETKKQKDSKVRFTICLLKNIKDQIYEKTAEMLKNLVKSKQNEEQKEEKDNSERSQQSEEQNPLEKKRVSNFSETSEERKDLESTTAESSENVEEKSVVQRVAGAVQDKFSQFCKNVKGPGGQEIKLKTNEKLKPCNLQKIYIDCDRLKVFNEERKMKIVYKKMSTYNLKPFSSDESEDSLVSSDEESLEDDETVRKNIDESKAKRLSDIVIGQRIFDDSNPDNQLCVENTGRNNSGNDDQMKFDISEQIDKKDRSADLVQSRDTQFDTVNGDVHNDTSDQLLTKDNGHNDTSNPILTNSDGHNDTSNPILTNSDGHTDLTLSSHIQDLRVIADGFTEVYDNKDEHKGTSDQLLTNTDGHKNRESNSLPPHPITKEYHNKDEQSNTADESIMNYMLSESLEANLRPVDDLNAENENTDKIILRGRSLSCSECDRRVAFKSLVEAQDPDTKEITKYRREFDRDDGKEYRTKASIRAEQRKLAEEQAKSRTRKYAQSKMQRCNSENDLELLELCKEMQREMLSSSNGESSFDASSYKSEFMSLNIKSGGSSTLESLKADEQSENNKLGDSKPTKSSANPDININVEKPVYTNIKINNETKSEPKISLEILEIVSDGDRLVERTKTLQDSSEDEHKSMQIIQQCDIKNFDDLNAKQSANFDDVNAKQSANIDDKKNIEQSLRNNSNDSSESDLLTEESTSVPEGKQVRQRFIYRKKEVDGLNSLSEIIRESEDEQKEKQQQTNDSSLNIKTSMNLFELFRRFISS